MALTEEFGASEAGSEDLVEVLAERPTAEFDEVKVQADYAARAMLSFYRFRQLGGGRMSRPKYKGAESEQNPPTRKLKLGRIEQKGVHYVSDHPDVRILQLSVIALLVLFESAANAYFFAQQSEFGISGGLFQAAAVSLANVAVSFFIIGFWGLRHVTTPAEWTRDPRNWDARNYYKIFGMIAIIVGAIFVLLVNLSAAHYRNLIDLAATYDLEEAAQALQATAAGVAGEGPSHPLAYVSEGVFRWPWADNQTCNAILNSEIGLSIGSAATNAMCRPFALHSLDAMVLFALGLSISALAAFEGRGADAAFPGLSDAARQFERARQDLQFALDDYYDAIDDRVAEAKRLAVGQPVDEDDAPAANDPAPGAGYEPLSRRDEMRLRDLLRRRVESYQTLLTSDPDLLSDEFGVEDNVVDRVVNALGGGGRY